MRKTFIAIAAAAALLPGGLYAKELSLTGNSECWGDNNRQDISCRVLTENFLLSMRGATKSEVVKAMHVEGREVPDAGLHFISNYSKGKRWGSGIVNFKYLLRLIHRVRMEMSTSSILFGMPNLSQMAVPTYQTPA